MDTILLGELLAEVKARGGGLVLNSGDKPVVVVLSVEKYYQLLQGVPVMDTELGRSQTETVTKKGAVLVTGGAGYIGAHAVRMLLESGFEPIVVDNLSTGKAEHVPEGVRMYQGDILDGDFLRDVFSQHEFIAVMHFAASLEVEESVREPVKYLQNNVAATEQLLGVMQEFGVTNIIFSSTAAVYGEQKTVPIPESAVPNPNNPYGYSKLLAEYVLRYFNESLHFSVTILRYFNVCGTNPDWGISDTHKNSHLIPVILEVAQGVRSSIVVNGDNYATSDGSCIRDYVHVVDVARAHVAALEGMKPNQFKVYNIGTGKGFSVKEMIAAAAEVTNRMIPMEIGPRRAGDAGMTIADSGLIKKDLGFTPTHSTLENIFSTSWKALQPETADSTTVAEGA